MSREVLGAGGDGVGGSQEVSGGSGEISDAGGGLSDARTGPDAVSRAILAVGQEVFSAAIGADGVAGADATDCAANGA